MRWLVLSLALSLLLTIVLNYVVGRFPHLAPRPGVRRTTVYFPWRGMLLASILLTVVINLLSLF